MTRERKQMIHTLIFMRMNKFQSESNSMIGLVDYTRSWTFVFNYETHLRAERFAL